MLSQNGWNVADPTDTENYPVPGTAVHLRLRRGAAATVLLYVARRFHHEVEPLRDGECWGWAVRLVRGSATAISNHASGTAEDLNAPAHPLGMAGTFTQKQRETIHRIVAATDGYVRWGGDYTIRRDEMHFEVAGSEDQLLRLIAKLGLQPDGTIKETDDMQLNDLIPGTSITVGTLLSRLADTTRDVNLIRADLATIKTQLESK